MPLFSRNTLKRFGLLIFEPDLDPFHEAPIPENNCFDGINRRLFREGT